MQHLHLTGQWQLKERDPALKLMDDFSSQEGWVRALVPGTVHESLLAAGLIPDPFTSQNERDVEWVGERDWLYRCVFDVPAGFEDAEVVALCLDGLDTVATLWLNGKEVLSSVNMFVPHRVPVKHLLRPGGNDLSVLFRSALKHGKSLEAALGEKQVWLGDPSRVYVRKAQYHYGWDWGPCLLTAGPWREVRLEAYSARISDLHCPAQVSSDLRSATLPVAVQVEADAAAVDLTLRLELSSPIGGLVAEALVPVEGTQARHTFYVDTPHLWWPRGYGEQALYLLRATLVRGGEELDRREVRLGLRRLRLVQEPLHREAGTTFMFECNDVPIFCGGANWIPADSFLPRISVERYRALLEHTAGANMTMLRVWGGGVYEDDAFYGLCDELGLLVWQDFMFACGIYPAHPGFAESVRAEAETAVRRLRHHPCLALWCGNNEDYLLARSLGIYDPSHEEELAGAQFPARALYERLLPQVCQTLDPTRPYWPGSPYGGADPNDWTVGDRHTWEVWHEPMASYHDYPRFAGRFVSEFGMQALPDSATITEFAEPAERHPQSDTLRRHNKAQDGPKRLAAYLKSTVGEPFDLEDYVYATQFVQAEALGEALRGWRRRWGGPGRYAVAGALLWQLNDCWPGTSWAIVDYALRPKPALYVVRRELAPLVVGLKRAAGGVEVWAANGGTEALEARLELSAWTLDGTRVWEDERHAMLAANRSTELRVVAAPGLQGQVIGARLLVGSKAVARAALWPEPFRDLTLSDPGIEVERLGRDQLRVSAARPAKGVLLMGAEGVGWSDNMLDLLPGDSRTIVARGLGEAEVRVRWFGMGAAGDLGS